MGIGAAPPTPEVAVFNDAAYVDDDGEGQNVLDDLAAAGANSTVFTGVDEASWSTAMATADVLVLPENEDEDVDLDLPAATQTAIAEWVASGGRLIVMEPSNGSNLAVVNAVFGTSMSDTGDGACPCDIANETGTEFEGVPRHSTP
ncbi:MAG: hypothetical protein OSA99_15640 [Acidimicrobiales bacterium]|nr:hypothetical protein [Acidimicrobiales bacterium]